MTTCKGTLVLELADDRLNWNRKYSHLPCCGLHARTHFRYWCTENLSPVFVVRVCSTTVCLGTISPVFLRENLFSVDVCRRHFGLH